MLKAWQDFRIRFVIVLVFVALIIMLCLVSNVLGETILGLSAWFAGALVTIAFIGLSVWLSVLIRPNLYTKAVLHNKVLGALLKASQKDKDPRVRARTVKGLAELDLEQSSLHEKHNKLDNVLVSALEQDSDPRVRAEAADGLANVELEESSYHHEHNKLDDVLFEPDL